MLSTRYPENPAVRIIAHEQRAIPKADIPVLQLSIHAGEEIDYHKLSQRLAPLRENGVLILGSGNVVHNLRHIDWKLKEKAFDWGEDFDAYVKEIMTTQPKDLQNVANHPAYSMAVPTPEHFLPLAYLAGLCVAAGRPAEMLVEGGTMGSVTMTSYTLGCDMLAHPAFDEAAASIPNPHEIPPEHTNI
jgi:4,5-DOPA dioxygenase extradiol